MRYARIPSVLGVAAGLLVCGPALSAQVYQASADTGRMVWGHTDYTRYTDAGYCDRAVATVFADQHRAYVPDTSAVSPVIPVKSTLPASVIAAACTCGERFTVEKTNPRELLSLVRILLVLGNDAQAQAAIERMVALQPTPEARAFALQRVTMSLLQAVPARLTMASEYLQRLEESGAPGASSLMGAHMNYASYWFAQYNPDSVRTHATRAVAVWKTMPQKEKDNAPIIFAYEYLINMANDVGDLATQEKILAQAIADGMGAWRGGNGDKWIGGVVSIIDRRKAVYGKKTRPLDGTFWFNHNNIPRPTPGKISLIVRLGRACGWECRELYETIQSLQAKYGMDLDVTLITETQGFLPGSGPLTPVEEAKGIANHFQTFLRLPVVIMVDEIPVDTISDGRLRRGQSRLSDIFPGGGATNTILVDREGKIVWLGLMRGDQTDRRLITFAIDRAAQKGQAGPHDAGTPAGSRTDTHE